MGFGLSQALVEFVSLTEFTVPKYGQAVSFLHSRDCGYLTTCRSR